MEIYYSLHFFFLCLLQNSFLFSFNLRYFHFLSLWLISLVVLSCQFTLSDCSLSLQNLKSLLMFSPSKVTSAIYVHFIFYKSHPFDLWTVTLLWNCVTLSTTRTHHHLFFSLIFIFKPPCNTESRKLKWKEKINQMFSFHDFRPAHSVGVMRDVKSRNYSVVLSWWCVCQTSSTWVTQSPEFVGGKLPARSFLASGQASSLGSSESRTVSVSLWWLLASNARQSREELHRRWHTIPTEGNPLSHIVVTVGTDMGIPLAFSITSHPALLPETYFVP